MKRIKRRTDRPMLKTADPAATLKQLMDVRYPVYAEADITVESREVLHEVIVEEILDRLRVVTNAGRGFGENAVTAPLRSNDPIVVDVALGNRAYDIVIGRDVLSQLGTRMAALRPGARAAIVTDENVGRAHLAAARNALESAGIGVTHVAVPPGEGSKSVRRVRAGLRGADRGAHRAQRSGRRARRRRDRRSCGLRGVGGAARSRFHPGADDALGASRFFGGRKNRHQFEARQESDRRVSSAGPGARRYRVARHAAAAPIPRRLCRGRKVRAARRRRFFLLARGQLERCFRRRSRARTRHRRELPQQGCDRVARRARERRARLAQSRPHLRPCAGGRGRLFRPAAAWRSGLDRHGAGVPVFRAAKACCRRRMPRARWRISPPSDCRSRFPISPTRSSTPTA